MASKAIATTTGGVVSVSREVVPEINLDEASLEISALRARIVEMESAATLGLNWRDIPEKMEQQLADEVPVFTSAKRLDVAGGAPSDGAHILIEGDNLHALYTLQATHKGRVDVIYIDPPYNTGKEREFIYNDKLIDSENRWRHSAWLSFMSKRLELAADLLAETGLVFVSIDDNEASRLRLLMDSVFGDDSWIATFVWRSDGNLDNQAQIKINHEYIHVYAKNKAEFKASGQIDPNIDESSKLHTGEIRNSVVKNGPKNPVSSITLPAGFPAGFENGTIPPRSDAWPHFSTPVTVKDSSLTHDVVVSSGWANATLLRTFIESGLQPVIDTKGQLTVFELTKTGAIENVKRRSEDQSHILSVLYNMGTTETAGTRLAKIGVKFPFPKPVKLIKYLIGIYPDKDALVLDFFAGSGTTGEAVAQLNAEDGGHRLFVLVTNNENDICRSVTHPRLKAILTGKWEDGRHEPLPGSLRFYTTSFLARRKSLDRMRTEIAAHTVDLVAVKEATTEKSNGSDGLSVLHGDHKTVAVVTTFATDHSHAHKVAEEEVREGDARIAYLFTWSELGIESETVAQWPGWRVAPLPAEMLAALRATAPHRHP